MNVSTRLSLGLGFLVLVVVLLASAGIATLSNLGRAMADVLSETKVSRYALQEMTRGVERQEGAVYAYAAGDPSSGYTRRFQQGHDLFEGALQDVRRNEKLLGPDGHRLLDQVAAQRSLFEKEAKALFAIPPGGPDMVLRFSAVESHYQKLHTMLRHMASLRLQSTIRTDQHVTLLIWKGRVWIGVTAALVFVSLIGIAMYMRRTVIVPLAGMAQTAAAVGKPNRFLRISYRGQDELGVVASRFNELLDELEENNQRLAQHQGLASQVLEAVLDLHQKPLAVVDDTGHLLGSNALFREKMEPMAQEVGDAFPEKVKLSDLAPIDQQPLVFRGKRHLGRTLSLSDVGDNPAAKVRDLDDSDSEHDSSADQTRSAQESGDLSVEVVETPPSHA